ncbi:cell adhesion molecule CEACAM21-like isoform 4-T4 [Tautogolabrus adspersus]
MDKLTLLFIVSVSFTGLTNGVGLLPDGPLNKAVGGTVMFTTVNPPESPFVSVSWRFGDKVVIVSNIVNTTSPGYEGRITFFPSTGSLELRSLSLSDSGEYTVRITAVTEEFDGRTTLGVYERISNPSITSSPKEPIEGNSVILTCDAAGSVFTRKWMKDGSDLTQADFILHDNNRVLSFQRLKKTDKGEYSCKISNPINSMEAKHDLVVNFFPEGSSGCSDGCIAGIVIACLVIVGAAAVAGYFIYKKKKRPKTSSNQTVGGGGQDNTAYTGNKELNYVDIAVFHRRDGGAVQLGSQNETSEYAQVRGNNNPPSTSSPPTYDAYIQRTKRPAPQPAANVAELYAQVRKT